LVSFFTKEFSAKNSFKITFIAVYPGTATTIPITPKSSPAIIIIKKISNGWDLTLLEKMNGCEKKLSMSWPMVKPIKMTGINIERICLLYIFGEGNTFFSGLLTVEHTIYFKSLPINRFRLTQPLVYLPFTHYHWHLFHFIFWLTYCGFRKKDAYLFCANKWALK